MGSLSLNRLLGYGIVGILFFSLFSCSNPSEQVATQAQLFKEYPNDWMYNQRAYPDNVINPVAMKQARLQTQAILATRNAEEVDWEFVGPLNTGGRITDLAISPVNNDHFYVTTAVGGVFRTYDRGANWEPIFDAIGMPSIGNIAIAPSDAQRIYVGTGEANGSATSGAFFGDGIYRSDDAGDSWTNMGLPNSNHIGRIVVDPQDPDRVFAAATGVLYDYNEDRGIYRTTNGGTDWERVLFVTDSTAAIDLVMNPVHTDTLYAAMWERTRKPWQRDYGGVTSAVHRSFDGGDTWEVLTNGLPAPNEQTGRIGLAIADSDPSTLYARYTTNEITNTFSGLYKSSDNGDSWTLISNGSLSNVDSSFGWYFGNVRVNPNDPDDVVLLGQSLFRTQNSGAVWDQVFGMHVDHHAMEFSKSDPNMILAGNDGGTYLSEDNGTTWQKFFNLPITQFYNIEVDFLDPINLYGGTQDNNTIRTSAGSGDDWFSVWGGDGFHVNVDPTDNNFAYAESQFGNLARSTDGGFSFVSALNGIDPSDRNNWNTPVILSPFNPEIVYYGSNRLYQSSNRAVSFTAISPDLTDGQHPSGALSYGTLTAIAASHTNATTIYTGSDDGNVNVTFDGGTTWTTVNNGLPNRYVTSIAIDPEDDLTAYVTLSGFALIDYAPHVFKTIDGGQNWTDISSNLPSIPANDIILIPDTDLLILATDLNIWYSDTDGASWDILGNNLPMTIIRDLKYHEPTTTLYAGTFGRSISKINLSDFVLSTEENSLANTAFEVYPNPAQDRINIRHTMIGDGTIMLYDYTGKTVKRLYEGNLATIPSLEFDSRDITSGLYLIRIQTSKQTVTQKLLIQ